MKLKNRKGFTLVELLVVIAIIGILAVVAVPALFNNINKAKVAKVESHYNTVRSAMLDYYAENNKLTSSFDELEIDGLNINQTPIGGDYKIRAKDSENKLTSSGGRITAHKIKPDGTVDSDAPNQDQYNKILLDQYGDAFLTLQGHGGNELHINSKQFKKLVDDIGCENIYISAKPSGTGYQTGEIYIRLANNLLPTPSS